MIPGSEEQIAYHDATKDRTFIRILSERKKMSTNNSARSISSAL